MARTPQERRSQRKFRQRQIQALKFKKQAKQALIGRVAYGAISRATAPLRSLASIGRWR